MDNNNSGEHLLDKLPVDVEDNNMSQHNFMVGGTKEIVDKKSLTISGILFAVYFVMNLPMVDDYLSNYLSNIYLLHGIKAVAIGLVYLLIQKIM